MGTLKSLLLAALVAIALVGSNAARAAAPTEAPLAAAIGSPTISGGIPTLGAVDFPVDGRISVRFSRQLLPQSLNEQTVVLYGPSGVVAARIVGAEGGLWVFVTPAQNLLPDSPYTLMLSGAADASGVRLEPSAISFRSKTVPPEEATSGSKSTTTSPTQWSNSAAAADNKVDAKTAQQLVTLPNAEVISQVPGYSRISPAAITPEESDRMINARVIPPDAITTKLLKEHVGIMVGAAGASPLAPASIAELARALRNDPDLIYEYVHNNIEYYPVWGVTKGALGALLDGQGTAFDQAELMVALLNQAGYTAVFQYGQINVAAADFGAWLGISTANACAVARLLGFGQIPAALSPSGSPGNCGALVSAQLSHIWVKVSIGGTQYLFDPSYKAHTSKAGIDLVAASGYNASTYLANARSGATITPDYALGINRSGIRANLATYANNLATYLRTNLPAGQLDDVVGGQTIVPYSGSPLRQTTLPYVVSTTGEWSAIPSAYVPSLTVAYSDISKVFMADVLNGSRLTISYDSSSHPQLRLDGTLIQQGTAVVTGAANVTLTVTHPTNVLAYQQLTPTITPKPGTTNIFLIANAWGPTGRGGVELHRTRLDNARAAGSLNTSELVMGSALAVLASTWTSQADRVTYIGDRLAGTSTLLYHRVGIAGYNGASYVDLPGNIVSVTSQSGNTATEAAAFFNSGMHSSIFESTAVQQTTGVSAVSTVKLLDLAASLNYKIFDAKSSNYLSAVQPNLTSCSGYTSTFAALVNNGKRLILPAQCNLAENTWTGVGYFSLTGSQLGAIIDGGLAGGFSTESLLEPQFTGNTVTNTTSTNNLTVSTGPVFGEPIDMTKGHYLYEHEDFALGTGAFPYSLNFKRLYSSGLRTQDSPLGKGWTHNLAISASVGSDGMQAMGEDSALDAAATVAEMLVSTDLLSDATYPLDKMVTATLGQRWFGDQLINNTVIVRTGLNGEIFLVLPDGSYNPPPGSAAKLTKNADTTYSYEGLHKARIDFNTNGKIAKYSLPNGIEAHFTYVGNDLSTVENSLGRRLTLTTTSTRLTKVADATRSVLYTVDSMTGNLTKFTDTLAKDTIYSYDLPGRLTQIFYPSNPTLPAMTNVYDTLGRVQTQANAFAKIYTYYFAGTRSEEVAPDGSSNVSYVNVLGNVLKRINAVGQVTLNTYDGQSRLIRTVLPELNSVEYVYDDTPCAAQLRCTHNVSTIRQIPKPASGQTTFASNFTYESAFNNVNHATDPLTNVTDYAYTAQGDPQTVTLPPDAAGMRPMTTYTYTGYVPQLSGYPTFYLLTAATQKIDTAQSTVTTTSYLTSNAYVPQTTIVDQGTGKLNLTTTYVYDGVGNLYSVYGPRTDVVDLTSYAYDTQRRLVKITDAKNKLTTLGYDPDGHRTRTAAQIGTQWLVSCRSFTTSGQLLKAWGPALTAADTTCPAAAAPAAVTDYAYNDLDRLQGVTLNLPAPEGGNRVSQTDYWPDGRVKSVRRAVGTPLAQTELGYTYTPNGAVATLTDANNNVTTYEYDGLDRRAKTRYPSPTAPGTSSATDYEQYGYDSNGNLTTLRRRNGQNVVLSYDNLNRAVSRTYPATPADNRTFGYDLLSHPTSANLADGSYPISFAWDNAGRLSTSSAGGKTLSYQYDAAGNRTRLTWPEATPFYVTTTFDELNRPTVIKELGVTTLAQYTYDDLSRRTAVALGNTTTTSYGFDAQGMLQTLGHDLAGTAQDVTFTYARNQRQDIKTLSWSNALYGWTGVPGSRTFTPNGLNQYTAVNGTALSYDGNGNLTGDGTWTYTYDADNRLRSAIASGVAATMSWDAGDRLRQTTISGTTTNLLYDGTRLIAEYDAAAGTLLRRYVHGTGIDEPLLQYDGAGTTSKTWYYANHLGSVVATADAAGTASASYSYGPFGETGAAAPARFGYTGQQYLGPLGLYYYKARFYSPALGRFLQTDPIGVDGGINLYAYVGNNAVNLTDPTGEFLNLPGALYGAVNGLVSGAITGWHTAGSTTGISQQFRGGAIGAVSGAIAGAAVGALFQPQISSVVAVQVASGVVSSLAANIGVTTATQAFNGSPFAPAANLNAEAVTAIGMGAILGGVATSVARLGTGLVNGTIVAVESVLGAGGRGSAPSLLPMPSQLVEAIVGGLGSGNGEIFGTLPTGTTGPIGKP